MRLTYLAEALHELTEAVRYHKGCHPSLRKQFFQRVEQAEEDILNTPETWPKIGRIYRRKLLRQFPFGLIYHLPEPDRVEIVAFMHLNRRPDYWRKRLTEE